MIDAALRLRRIAAALREGRPIPTADAEPLADGLDAILAGAPPLDALGLAADAPGGTSPRRRLLLDERDAALRNLAAALGVVVDGENSEGCWEIADRPERETFGAVGDGNSIYAATVLRASGGRVPTRRTIAAILR